MIDVGAIIAQGALPHGPMLLGNGPRTHAQAGCLFASVVMSARALTTNKTLNVVDAQRKVMVAKGFLGSALEVPIACRELGTKLVSRGAFDVVVVEGDIKAGRPVVVGIDFIPGRSSGFSDADHFVVVVDVVPGALVVADPGRGVVDKIRVVGPQWRGRPALLAEMLRFDGLPQ